MFGGGMAGGIPHAVYLTHLTVLNVDAVSWRCRFVVFCAAERVERRRPAGRSLVRPCSLPSRRRPHTRGHLRPNWPATSVHWADIRSALPNNSSNRAEETNTLFSVFRSTFGSCYCLVCSTQHLIAGSIRK